MRKKLRMFWYLLTIKPVVKRSFNGRKIGAIWPIPRPWLARGPNREEPPTNSGNGPVLGRAVI